MDIEINGKFNLSFTFNENHLKHERVKILHDRSEKHISTHECTCGKDPIRAKILQTIEIYKIGLMKDVSSPKEIDLDMWHLYSY